MNKKHEALQTLANLHCQMHDLLLGLSDEAILETGYCLGSLHRLINQLDEKFCK